MTQARRAAAQAHSLADQRQVMRLRGTYRLLATIAVAIIVWVGWNPDARFESSDARW